MLFSLSGVRSWERSQSSTPTTTQGKHSLATKYWCHLWEGDRIVAGFPIERGDDAAAVLVAFRAMNELDCTAADLSTEGGRKVCTISRNGGKSTKKRKNLRVVPP